MEWAAIAVLWLVCGIVSYLIAKERDAVNPLYWMVMGFLLGPFGVLAAFFAPVNAERPPTPGDDAGSGRA